MPDDAIDRLIEARGLKAHTRSTITDRRRLRQEIEAIRRHGIAFDNEELNPGVKCVAAPIKNSSGSVVAAISLSGPTQRFTPSAIRRFEKDIKAASLEISRAIGFNPAQGISTGICS
jgi:DNA-binding IclR family transcriptional regulator